MRLLLVSTFLLSTCAFTTGAGPLVGSATAAECSGENCPPPASQGRGRDCEHEKQEQTTS